MFLKEYINKVIESKSSSDFKSWVDHSAIAQHVSEQIPNARVEEWKNFRTNYLNEINWKILSKESSKKNNSTNGLKIPANAVVFIDGYYNPGLSSADKKEGINVYSVEDYLRVNPELKKNFYNSPSKYAENRLSGSIDKKPTYFLSLNCLLSSGIVIEVERGIKIEEKIDLIHVFTDDASEAIINPYVNIISKEKSEVCFQEVFYNMNCWVNHLTEVFIEKKAKVKFSRFQRKIMSGIKTSSLNFHLEEEAELDLKVINREKCKEDIRVFLNKDSSSVKIAGLILSNKKNDSDVFCKIVHRGKLSISEQKWRLISAENGKTAINGKICVNKNAKGSDANFYSKSLVLDQKATSFSKPELEILEDEVKCKHGASFGELDNQSLFYMQSRGIQKEEAIMMLIYAFIEEIGLNSKSNENLGHNIVNDFFKEIKESE